MSDLQQRVDNFGEDSSNSDEEEEEYGDDNGEDNDVVDGEQAFN